MSNLKNDILEIYKKYNFRASPVLDQFFLIDSSTITRLIKYAHLKPEDTVLEIGIGLGFVTDEILKYSKVVGIEKDRRLEKYLSDKYSGNEKANILIGDFLGMQVPKFNKIISNIPYSKSSEIVFKLLDYDFEVAIITLQKEFADKMLSTHTDKEYGRLSVMAQCYFEIEKMEVLPKIHFFPPVSVDSMILRMKKRPIPRDLKFDNFIQQVFRYKNKTVHNALKIAFNKDIVDDRPVDNLSIDELKEVCEKVM